jgi:aspartyl/asparaginyl-tRNA synthetase
MSRTKRTNIQNITTYNTAVNLLREFFTKKGFVEIATQPNLTILSACENPFSVATYNYNGEVWPLPQTGQMILEEVLLSNPQLPGVFCVSTSYRAEKNPIPGRHETIFPMFEFESKGKYKDLILLEKELLEYLGFGSPVEMDYNKTCKEYGDVSILENEHESKMWNEVSHCVSLQNFPLRTNPFWNMKNQQDDIFNKVDVILYGQETIGAAERSCDVESMRKMFYTIENGGYSEKLFELFGKERVEGELEEFLKFDFFPRFGAGIGLTRLARAMELLQKQTEKEALELQD